jgi:DNA polymerase (family 10)
VALRQDPETATKRLCAAARHPLVSIVGHPTGRLIPDRKGLEPDIEALVAAAVENETALEINANPHRLDLRDIHARVAIEAGCRLAIDTDAHRADHLAFLRYGVLTARRAGATVRDCVNCLSEQDLLAWLRRGR